MNHSNLLTAVNSLAPALGRMKGATEAPSIYRHGRAEASAFPVAEEAEHTEYLWFDSTAFVGITHALKDDVDAEAEMLGTKDGAHVVGTTDPLPLEWDPSPSFPWDLVPYDRTTVAQLILAIWFETPEQAPLYARKARGEMIFCLEHEGAFDFRWMKIGPAGVAGKANLSLLDDEQRPSILRLVAQMSHGHFIPEEEADVFISDLSDIEKGFAGNEPGT